ncbi:hypothetical protein QOZ80_2AG0115190 [Eleusine coracana subsp. coracana]|nr:hypothetical protein QOZ80_2AG0115190 [Eleusine coracana subsp. coracana]
MARSGGPGAPAASSGGTMMSLTEYLDGPDALARRAASSLAIARSEVASRADGPRIVDGPGRDDRRTQSSRRASLTSGWRSRAAGAGETVADLTKSSTTTDKSTWRSWKPVRALSHLRMRRAGCLFSIEVVATRGLPASMEGHRLAVIVRKAETKAGAVQTMPSRVRRDGAADFDETLFVRCNLYFTGGKGTGKPLRLEPRRFVVSVVAVEARGGVTLGTHAVDVSALVLDSLQKMMSSSSDGGRRVRRFDTAFALSEKAAGGELVIRLGFQLMEDAGLSLYTQAEDVAPPVGGRARAHDRNSFSISRSSTPKLSLSPVHQKLAQDAAISPSTRAYKHLVNKLRIDEHGGDAAVLASSPAPALPHHQTKQPGGDEDNEKVPATTEAGLSLLPEYEVVEKGVEPVEKGVEAVKEVVHYQPHRDVLRELDSIAEQIEAIEALMTSKSSPKAATAADQQQQQQLLEADEQMVTVEFLRKLEAAADDDVIRNKLKQAVTPRSNQPQSPRAPQAPPVVPDLGPTLGPAVQTRDGGFLVSMNPFDVPLASRDGPPKLAMQVSRLFVLPGAMAATGFDVLHNMAAAGGADEVREKLASFGRMDNLTGKAPEQVGFEGIAEAVIGGRRSTEGASSSAARSVQLVRRLASAVCAGRGERVATGIWTTGADPETLEEVLAFSMQKLEAMAVDALAIQAEMADEDAPFEVGAAAGEACVFDSLVPYDEWSESSSQGSSDSNNNGRVTLVAAVQLRDPSRRYEAVGAPMVAVVQSARLLGAGGHGGGGRFKVRSLHVGGVQVRCQPPSGGGAGGSSTWGAERQKLTAMQWMLAHGYDRAAAGRRAATPTAAQARARRQRPDVIWSLSSRVLAGMWLKTVRNPDVRIGASKCHVCDPSSSPNVAAA